MPRQRWRVRLSEPAEQDFLAILNWTAQNCGRRQASVYRRTLIAALAALTMVPMFPEAWSATRFNPGFVLCTLLDGAAAVATLVYIAPPLVRPLR